MLKPLKRYAGVVLLGGGLFASAIAPAMSQNADAAGALESWVAGLDALPEIEATYESLTGRGSSAILSGLTIVGPELIMAFEPISVAGYRDLPPTGFAFDSFDVGRIQGRTPTAEINVIDLSIDNLVVPETGFVFDPEEPFTSILDIWGKAEQISMDELSMRRIDIGQYAGGLDSVVSYHNYVVKDWADGRIGSTHAGPLIMESPTPDPLFLMTVDELISEDIDIGALAWILDPAGYENGDREWRTFLGHAEYNNVIVEAPDIQMRVRTISFDDFKMRQAAEPFVPILEQLARDLDISPRKADAMMQEVLLDLISPWGIGDFSIQGLDIYADDIDRFHIGEFYIADLSLDGIGEIGVSDVDVVVGGEFSFRLGYFAFGGVEFPSEPVLEELMAAIAAGGELDALTNIIPALGYLEIAGLELGAEATLPISVDRLVINTDGYIGPIPTENRIEVAGLVVPLTLIEGEVRQILNQLGYTEFIVDFGLGMSWDEATETLLLEDFHIAIAGAGSITATMELGGVPRQLLEDPDGVADAELLGIEFNWAEFVITDEAVADRLFRWTAEGTDTPPEQYRDEFIRGLPFLLGVSMDRVVALAIAPALQDFLRSPSTLTISARPEEPVPFLVMGLVTGESPFDLLELLNVELSVEPLE